MPAGYVLAHEMIQSAKLVSDNFRNSEISVKTKLKQAEWRDSNYSEPNSIQRRIKDPIKHLIELFYIIVNSFKQ